MKGQEMIIKIYNIFLKISISILLVISLWLVVDGALKRDGVHFEFGNLMDFFNSLGTIGTLIVAYLAFKSAPQWLNQKLDDHALEIAKELITTTYPTLAVKFRELSIHIENFHICSSLIDTEEAYKDLSKELSNLSEKILKIEDCCFNSKLQLDSLYKLGWHVKQVHLDDILKLQASMNNYLSYLKSFDKQMIIIRGFPKEVGFFTGDIKGFVNEKERLSRMSSENKDYSDEFMRKFDEFFNNQMLVSDYFDIKSLKAVSTQHH
ncbi:hypothetical protein WKH71_05415 [Pantoea agglomerans]